MTKISYKRHRLHGVQCEKCSKLINYSALEGEDHWYAQLRKKCRMGQWVQYCSVDCMTTHHHEYHKANQMLVYYRKEAKRLKIVASMFSSGN